MSTAIRRVHYKPEIEELSIWFGPDFRRSKYFDVPQALYDDLNQAESKGRFFNAHIRGRFECARVEDPKSSKRYPPFRSAS